MISSLPWRQRTIAANITLICEITIYVKVQLKLYSNLIKNVKLKISINIENVEINVWIQRWKKLYTE